MYSRLYGLMKGGGDAWIIEKDIDNPNRDKKDTDGFFSYTQTEKRASNTLRTPLCSHAPGDKSHRDVFVFTKKYSVYIYST
jgi:hypothetical protein